MARRVGFGKDVSDGGPKGRSGGGQGGRFDGGDDGGDDGGGGRRKNRLVPAVFLTVWLVLWAAGMFYVAGALLGEAGAESGVGSLAMIIWLAVAVVGWLIGLRALRRVLRGEPIMKRDPNKPRLKPTPRPRDGSHDPPDPDYG